MKKAFVVFSQLDTIKPAIVSFKNIVLNMQRVKNAKNISKVEYDVSNKKLIIFFAGETKKENNIPNLVIKKEDGLTQLCIEHLYPTDSKRLITVLNEVIKTLESFHSTHPDTFIQYLDVMNNTLTMNLNGDIDIKKVTKSESLNELNKCLMIIDGDNLLNRCYYATAYNREEVDLEKDKDGNYINAIKLFIQMINRFVSTYLPTHLIVMWDSLNPFQNNFRKQFYLPYKGNRENKPDALQNQLFDIKPILNQMNIAQFTDKRGLYEADDLIGSFIECWKKRYENAAVYIVSNDKDLFQLLDDNVYQVIRKGNKEIEYSLKDFEQEYGISPRQWIDVKAIIGDKSDNIPGVNGVGEKYIYDLLKEYQSVENIYNNLHELKKNKTYKRYVSKFKNQRKEAELSKFLATIIKDKKIVEGFGDVDTAKININQTEKEKIYKRLEIKKDQDYE